MTKAEMRLAQVFPGCFLKCWWALVVAVPFASAQSAWFADGYHGGIQGHYPANFTEFMVEALRQNPEWSLNLEIEPETWDFARTNTPAAYERLKALAMAPDQDRRIEFVNPSYGQAYLWNISGESVIQQLSFGLRKIHEHFPRADVVTYCTEEPCFTSALPGLLKSFGFRYAVLKNPNTCWGGYTRAYGGELVNWIGPDGTRIRTVPRYEVETLKPGSTWETIAAANSVEYIRSAQAAGILQPVGMCLQDAGWRFGPWLRRDPNSFRPSEYVTWRRYFETVVTNRSAPDWRLSQEDIQVSLVWGAQVLQRIAQQVRSAENQVVIAEKMATLASVYGEAPWPTAELSEAWRTLLLAQHHDCWIVPYNGRPGDTWADKVQRWTDGTIQTSQAISSRSIQTRWPGAQTNNDSTVRVFNPLGSPQTNLVTVAVPTNWAGSVTVLNQAGRQVPSQLITHGGAKEILFVASAPALGFSTFRLEAATGAPVRGATAVMLDGGRVRIETDLYQAELDPAKGGTFRSLLAKKLGNRELIDPSEPRRFNEIRGYFFEDQQFKSTADGNASIEVVESGPARVRLRVSSQLGTHPVTQWISIAQGQPRIDLSVTIDWQGSPGIGAQCGQSERFQREDDRKAFYDNRCKLLALFPVNLRHASLFKDAPFDVTASRLTNTFFDTWSSIKNDVMLHWVDLYDRGAGIGLALFGDHTTSYAHGPDHPLAMTLQYSGLGLWGFRYSIKGPTTVHYAVQPHAGDWRAAGLWTVGAAWNEPLSASFVSAGADPGPHELSFLAIDDGGWEVPALRFEDGKVLVRLFNSSSDGLERTIHYGAPTRRVELLDLNGEAVKTLPVRNDSQGRPSFKLALPSMGVGTLRITPGRSE